MAIYPNFFWGSQHAANNGPVTSTPSGSWQPGDFIVIAVGIRENGADFQEIAGWTRRGPISRHPTEEVYINLFTKFWEVGDSSVTITPTGGGSNDTVILDAIGFRGVHPTDPLIGTTLTRTEPTVFQQAGTTVPDGSVCVGAFFYDNDVSPDGYHQTASPPTGGTTSRLTKSVLGADASLRLCVRWYTQAWSTEAGTTIMSVEGAGGFVGQQGLFMWLRPAPTGTTHTYNGAGGGKAGGAATSSLTSAGPLEFPFNGSGGCMAGGAAGTATGHKLFAATGGAVAGGTGDHFAEYKNSHMATGGGKAGGAESITKTYTTANGLTHRVTGSPSQVCGSGTLNVTIPASAQIGDLLVLYYGYFSSNGAGNAPATPSGWTFIINAAPNGAAGGYVYWRKCESGDPGSTVSIAFQNDVQTAIGKYAAIMAFRNTDWQHNSGNPLAGTPSWPFGNDQNGTVYVYQSRSDNYKNTTVQFETLVSSSATIAASGEQLGYAEILDSDSSCSYSASIIAHMAQTDGIRAAPYDPLIALYTTGTSGYRSTCAVAFVGRSPSEYWIARGGGKAGGASGSVYEPKPPSPEWWMDGGGKAGGAAHTIRAIMAEVMASGGVAINAAARTVLQFAPVLSDAVDRVFAEINGSRVRITQTTLRMSADEMTATVIAIGPIIATIGQTLSISVEKTVNDQTVFVHQAISMPITSINRSGDRTTITASSAGALIGGSFDPDKIQMIGAGVIRAAPDFRVTPGCRYQGAVIQSVVTTLGVNSPWFTEVRF